MREQWLHENMRRWVGAGWWVGLYAMPVEGEPGEPMRWAWVAGMVAGMSTVGASAMAETPEGAVGLLAELCTLPPPSPGAVGGGGA